MEALKVVWLLWLFSSAGSVSVSTMPSQLACVEIQIQLLKSLRTPPRVGLYDAMCLPTLNPSYRGAPKPTSDPRYGT